MTEEELIENINLNRRKGERMLYDTYYNYAIRLSIRYVGNDEDAYEVLNDAFLKTFQKITSFEFRGEGSLKAWISKIIVNSCLMQIRKRKIDFVEIKEFDQDASLDYSNLDAEYIFMEIRNLPLGYRTVFNLHEIEGYSHKEISQKLGIAKSTSRSQLTMAKKILREKLSE